jgi:SAM-dependent methyltransferase
VDDKPTPVLDADPEFLREEIVRLGPWHYELEVTPEVSTRAFLDAPEGTYPDWFGQVSFIPNFEENFTGTLRRVYPEGLAGRSMLDCACNCGAYLFVAKNLGAGECFGSDVREHWIEQARFLSKYRTRPAGGVEPQANHERLTVAQAAASLGITEGAVRSRIKRGTLPTTKEGGTVFVLLPNIGVPGDQSKIEFRVCDLYELPKRGLTPFDITLFNGIFYHLPDPVSGLKVAADLTRELLIVNTATRTGQPDGMLVLREESKEMILSGVHGLNWLPTGPDVLTRILRWLGFPEVRLHWHVPHGQNQPADLGRLELFAARDKGTFEAFDRSG